MTNPRLEFTRSRRSAVLFLFSGMFILIGFSYRDMEEQITSSPAAKLTYAGHLQVMSLNAWGLCFIGAGIVAFVCGYMLWHTFGFVVLMGVCSWWGFEFVATWISTGYARAVLGGLIWGLLVGLLFVVNGWKDPAPTRELDLPPLPGWIEQ